LQPAERSVSITAVWIGSDWVIRHGLEIMPLSNYFPSSLQSSRTLLETILSPVGHALYKPTFHTVGFDVDSVPRISFQKLPADLAELLGPRVERLGYLGEFFQVAAHQPRALGHFVRFTEALKDELPDRLMELVALTASTRLENDYERLQHERLSLKLGCSLQWVRAVERLEPATAEELEPLERVAQALVLSVVDSMGRESTELAERFVALSSPSLLVGVLLATGRYLAHAAVCNTIGIEPPVSSPIEAPESMENE
jgi:alkylhydroperoxidase family enzyme